MKILGIESSCDETSAAVVEMTNESRTILSNIVASQIAVHALYGGVVPEIASRAHTEAISRVTAEALTTANCTMADIDLIAVTAKPGLIGALLVGVSFAKGLAYAYGKPLVGVHHIRGHIAANYPVFSELAPPFLALVVSGGHTSIVRVRDYTHFETVGRTRDDAAGEAFDKVARVMGLPYPGGAELDRLASAGNPDAIRLPSAAIADDSLDFSFSGLKTAVMNRLHHAEQVGEHLQPEDVAASFTYTLTSSITKKLEMALRRYPGEKLVLAGGVSANSHLRAAVTALAKRRKVSLYYPPRELCGDNAAMIAVQGYYEYLAGNTADLSLNAEATAEVRSAEIQHR